MLRWLSDTDTENCQAYDTVDIFIQLHHMCWGSVHTLVVANWHHTDEI